MGLQCVYIKKVVLLGRLLKNLQGFYLKQLINNLLMVIMMVLLAFIFYDVILFFSS